MNTWMQKYRQRLLIAGPLLVFIICFILYIFSGQTVSTDDAYVKAGIVAISTNISGQVAAVYVHDNQPVKKGEPLFKLDDRLYKIAVESNMAALASARMQIEALKATYQQQTANLLAAKNTYLYQQQELERQKNLAASGISSQMQLNRALNVFNKARQQLAAKKQLQANILANLGNNPNLPVDSHPLVQGAQARLNQAELNLSYTLVKAPIDGIITKVEQLQEGDYIKRGTPVFALISNKDIWIEANFKETQITHMRPGQKAIIIIDAYPNKRLIGHVVSTSPGTGSAFALLPPENATGNWVKIVQRLPVRISIDNSKAFLSSGLSATVTVELR